MNRTIAGKPSLLNHENIQKPLHPAQPRADSAINTDDSADGNQPKNVAEVPAYDAGEYTVQQVAEWAGLSRQRLYRMIRDGEIEARPATSGPRKWLIPAQEAWPLMDKDLCELA